MFVYEDHAAAVTALAFDPDGAALASGDRDGRIVVRDAGGWDARPVLADRPKTGAVHAVAFHPSRPLLFVAEPFGWQAARPTDAGDWVPAGPTVAAPVTAMAVLDANTVAVGTGDRLRPTAGTFELWDAAGTRRLEPFFREPNGVRAVAVAARKKMVAWANGHRQVSVWDVTKQDRVQFPQQRVSPAIALSPTGANLAVADDYAVKLFDVEGRRERAVLKGHRGLVTALAFSPDGGTVASGSWDQTVRVWDAATGRELAAFKWDAGRVLSLTYAPDGLRLAAGTDLGRVVVWDME